MTLNAITNVLKDRSEGKSKRDTHREGHGKMEAETGVMQPQAQECQSSHQTQEEANYRFSLEPQREGGPARFWTSNLQNCERTHFHCCKPSSFVVISYSRHKKLIQS